MKSDDIERSSHVMPTLACAMAGIYGCGIQESAHLNMKTRHCISGWDRVVPSGLWLCTSWKAWHIVIVCVPQTAMGVTYRGVNALILLD